MTLHDVTSPPSTRFLFSFLQLQFLAQILLRLNAAYCCNASDDLHRLGLRRLKLTPHRILKCYKGAGKKYKKRKKKNTRMKKNERRKTRERRRTTRTISSFTFRHQYSLEIRSTARLLQTQRLRCFSRANSSLKRQKITPLGSS